VKHAVHPEAHPYVVLLGLDVDVGGAVGDGLLDDVVDELDRGRFRADLGELGQVVLGERRSSRASTFCGSAIATSSVWSVIAMGMSV